MRACVHIVVRATVQDSKLDAHREPPTPLRGCDQCTGAHVDTWLCVPWCCESVTLLFSMTSGLTREEYGALARMTVAS
jgi:hypothetical protein